MKKKQRPFGTWPSAISPSLVAGSSVRLGELASDHDGTAYWIESRPEEGGRSALVTHNRAQGMRDVLPLELSVRSRIHEYGGGAFLAVSDGEIYFTNANDQDV
ncbi:MAG: hypothetical protein K8F25_16090, partial [Fimbriimonadaceae bacterium]|nr:hypothetical protein [Alphaproteobacteria bacterium]